MTRFTDIDLARLPALPAFAESFEAYRAAYMVDLAARLNAVGIPYDVGALRSDTYAVTGEAFAYRTVLVATSVDDALRAVLLPTSWGAYLDALGASQSPGVARNPLVADPRPYVFGTDAAADWEADDAFRARIQLASEALSTCGPEGAYLFFALEVDGVKAAGTYGPMSFGGSISAPFAGLGEVHIPIVAVDGDGSADPSLVAAVASAVTSKDRRPIADFVTVSAATILPYRMDVVLRIGPGSDPGIVAVAARARLRALADFQHRPGGQVLAQDIFAAAKVPDRAGAPIVPYADLGTFVDVNATPISPATTAPAYIAPYCPPDGITVTIEVDDD